MANSNGGRVEDVEPKEESVDLTQAIGARYGSVRSEEWDHLRSRAYAQMGVTFVLLGTFILVVVGAGLAIFFDWATIQEVRDLLAILLPGLLALLGSAVAFYFASMQ